jgi:excisionase family DNA binding protein
MLFGVHRVNEKNSSKPSYLTVRDIAVDLQVHENTVRQWIKTGALAAISFAGQYRVSRADYAEFLKKHRKQPPTD